MAAIQNEQTIFLWEGRDKRGSRLKGQQVATSPNLVRAELRRQALVCILRPCNNLKMNTQNFSRWLMLTRSPFQQR